MPARKGIMPKKFEAHQQNVNAHQALVISFHVKILVICRTYRHAVQVVKVPVSSRC